MGKKNNTKFYLLTLLKGALIGGTMMVPGVSGGSMAIILGIYDQLVSSVSSFFKSIKKNILFLLIFVAGAGCGMLLIANPLLKLIETFEKPTLYFFIGVVAGGVPLVCKQSQIKKFSWKYLLYIIVGILIVVAISFLPENMFNPDSSPWIIKILLLLLAGIIAAVALILPGISVTLMLLVLGLYQSTITAIKEFDLLFLLPLGIGVVLGIFLTTKVLEMLMKKFPQATYLIILGFVLGSVGELFPGLPSDLEWLICVPLTVAGFVAILLLSRLETSKN